MGVGVSVSVGVGVSVGLGVTVNVGEGVLLGVSVAVIVALGATVQVAVGPENIGWLHAASHAAITNKYPNLFIGFLCCDIKERVMVIDLLMIDAEGVISIADVALG